MFEKLKAAISKAGKRQKAREAEVRVDAGKAHQLSSEISDLRKAFKNATDEVNEISQKILDAQRKGEKQNVVRLQKKHDEVRSEIADVVHRLRWKVGKRADWRTRRSKALKRARWWAARKTTLRKKLKTAEEEWHRTHRLAFESWMLNGCPDIDNPRLKRVIAFMVVVGGQYVTATTNGTHTPTSYHYSERAVDFGQHTVSSMEEAAVKARAHFTNDYFLEFFSPCGWWIKYGIEYPGHFPAHGDHSHTAVEK